MLFGFSLTFGDSHGGLIGRFGFAGLRAPGVVVGYGIPLATFAIFEPMFAIITAALLSGPIADRARFWPWTVFIALWTVGVYVPLAHWIFAFDGFSGAHGGWLANGLRVLDFAGGTAVEVNSEMSALALALVLGRRQGWPREPMRPHNLPATLLGAGLLWFGWYGFNTGSALAASPRPAATSTRSARSSPGWPAA